MKIIGWRTFLAVDKKVLQIAEGEIFNQRNG
jgi:hypothetical protein